jgi:hypothetical protein
MVMVEPRGTEMGRFTLRAADEVRAAQFASVEGEVNADMGAIAKAICRLSSRECSGLQGLGP